MILQNLKNEKYVLQIIEKIQDDTKGLAAIVTEICDCNLTKILELNKFNFEQILAITYQLLNGLLVISKKNIIHSDIKPDNILYCKSKNQFLIADYGLSKIINNPTSKQTNYSLKGNGFYMSPEVLKKQKPYMINADVYSIGLILVEAFIQRGLTYDEQNELKYEELLEVIPNLKNSENFEFIEKILSKMVDTKKETRPYPITLLKILNTFDINEDSLKQLGLNKQLKIMDIKDISQAKNYDIVEIDLGGNSIDAKGVKNIGMSLEKCRNITYLNLDLGYNSLGAKGAKNIGMSLEKCQNITSLNLNLGDNSLGAEGAKNIGISLEKCKNITSLILYLFGNSLDAEGAKNIGISLEKCQNITSLNLNLFNNKIGAEGARNIGMSLEKCKNITSLNLNLFYNSLEAEGAKNIGMSLEKCKNITSLNLNLSGNSLGAEGAKNIGMSLEKCQNITSLNLDLGDNSLGANGAKNIGMSLEKCKNITSLNLNLFDNSLGAKGAKNIGMSLEKCQNITSLNLNLFDNSLGAEGAKNIGMSLENCKSITSLNLNLFGNSLDAEGAKNIGMILEKCQNITSLNLDLGKWLEQKQLFAKNRIFINNQSVLKDRILGGGICGSKANVQISNSVTSQQQMQQILNHKDKLKQTFQISNQQESDEEVTFEKFNKQYDKYFTTKKIKQQEIETDVRKIIEKTLYDYREQIIQQEIRDKVIDMINLLINYLLIIQQNNSKQSIQSDINQINDKLQILSTYCKENKERFPCLDLYQYFEILTTLNSQRVGLDVANQSISAKILSKVIQVVKFGAGFVSIAGAIKNLTEIDLKEMKNFINEIKQIAQSLTSESSTEGINIALNVYSDYNTNNISNNIYAIWIRKVQYLGENLTENDPILEIIFYLEEIINITNNDTRLFVYMQLNYLLSKQQMKDNFQELSTRLEQLKKRELIIQQANFLQMKEYSDGIVDKIKNLANLIAQSHQFRYIKAQLLLHFAQILSHSNKKDQEFIDVMTSIVSNYLQEKQKSVKIIFEGNQIMADFIHNHLDKSKVLTNISLFKKQMTKHLDDQQQFNDFAFDIQNEKDLEKYLAKYFVQIWELSVKQRQKKLQITHKDDALLEAIHLYVNQQITYQDGQKFNTEEKDALKQIINCFLVPNFAFSADDVQQIQPSQQFIKTSSESKCKIISILAEGGSGKSMLLKKLEVELLNRNSDYTKDNRSDYIPFIIKCNSLDKEKPSIEDYLESVNIKRKDIDMLKKSERNKLVMLDGFDEYTGDYFKVYQKLKLNEWVNTLVIVTSRLEKITFSDAKVYFNYYNNEETQEESDSFTVFKLEKITEQDIQTYLKKYKYQKEQEKQTNYNSEQHEKLEDIIFKNKQLIELLKLPINLYLTTRMITDLDLNEKNVSNTFQAASDQIEIQELFFQYQFKKQSQIFIEQQKQLKLDQKLKQELVEKIEACYFEYFQSIAMLMLIQKGKKSNYLSTTRDSVKFQLRQEVINCLKKNGINIEELIQNLKSYVDSRVITRIKLTFNINNEEILTKKNETQFNEQQADDIQKQEFEFRHKSLFEYFAARAMKYDFDLHQEEIYKLDISQLNQFNINKKIIMSSQRNASEQQILIKLYKLMKPFIDSQSFKETYTQQEVSQTNRYIQFLKRSQISKYTETSQIDIGASNLLSALFISKFLFPNIIFQKCSFSQAYISSHPPKLAEFQDCNLENSLIEKQKLENFETSNTKNVMLSGFQKQFDTDDIFQFNQVIFYNNTIISITKTGFINQFEFKKNQNESCKKLLSNQITNAPLKQILFIDKKNVFLVRGKKSLFEIDAKTFERLRSYTFSYPISSLSISSNQNYIITLQNQQIFQGDIQEGFAVIDSDKIQAEQSLSINDMLVTSKNGEINTYKLENLQLIDKIKVSKDLKLFCHSVDGKYLVTSSEGNACKIWSLDNGLQLLNTLQGHLESITYAVFSPDGKYLVTGSKDKTCNVWNVSEEFKLVSKIVGHIKKITSIAFSKDGQYIATASKEKTCKLWEIERGFELVNKIEGHTGNITSVAYSADGMYLATGSGDQTCKIWKVEKEFELINVIKENNSKVISIAFSADSTYFATCLENCSCKIWDAKQEFKCIKTIEGHTSRITSIAFSPDGKYFATGSYDRNCKIWNIKKGFELEKNIEDQNDMISSISFSADSKYLAIGSYDKTCKIWSLDKEYQLINTLKGHNQPIISLAYSKDGKYLATGSQDKTCRIWSVEKNYELIYTIEKHTSYVTSVAFSPDLKYLATGSEDNTCKIWNIEKGFEFINSIQGHTKIIYSVAFSSDGKTLATSSEDFTCKIWNIERSFELINKNKGHENYITSVAFSADCKYLATGSWDNTFKIWNIEKGFDLIYSIQGHEKIITSVAFSDNCKYFATCSWDNTCKIWNIDNQFQLLKKIEGHTSTVTSVVFSADGKYLLTGSYDKTCKIWNVEKEFELVNTIKGCLKEVFSVAFSFDGKYLAIGSADNTCEVRKIEKPYSLIKLIQGHTKEIYKIAFSYDNKYLAIASGDFTCTIWDIEKGFELVNTLRGFYQIVTSVAFSRDSKYLATSCYDKTCKLWSIEKEFQLVNTVYGHTHIVSSVAFSGDGKYLATASADNTCKIWNFQKGLGLINGNQGDSNLIKSLKNNDILEQIYEL